MDNRRTRLTAVALAVIATRVALFAFLGGYLAEPARDQELYLRLAGTIMDGGGLAFSEDVNLLRHSRADGEGLSGVWAEDPGYVFGLGPVGEPTAMIEPGYPLLLAASMSILGRVSGAVFLPGLLAQIVGAWAAMGLATRLSDSRRGLVAGLLFAIYPYYVFYTANAMTEAIHTAMIPVILLMTVLAMDGRVRPAGAGLATGLLFLVRSTALFILPIQMLFVLKARGWRGASAVLLGFSLCAAPWMARNWIELGSPALLPTKGPLNLWMRNNPEVLEAEGIHRTRRHPDKLPRASGVPGPGPLHDRDREERRAWAESPRVHAGEPAADRLAVCRAAGILPLASAVDPLRPCLGARGAVLHSCGMPRRGRIQEVLPAQRGAPPPDRIPALHGHARAGSRRSALPPAGGLHPPGGLFSRSKD